MNWILGNAQSDFLFIYLPALMAIIFATFFPGIAESSFLYVFLAYILVDSGHVYTTLWRTYFNKEELRSRPYLYLFTPIMIASLFMLWGYIGFSYLWSFVVYSTLFHQIRQNYGILRWYQKQNDSYSDISSYFMWAFCGLPIIAYHFRDDVVRGFYSGMDLFSWSNEAAFNITIIFWAMTVLIWSVYEFRRFKSGHYDISRSLYLLFLCLLYSYCFFVGQKPYQVLIPLLLAHGVAYFALMSKSLFKSQAHRFPKESIAVVIVLITAAVFGFLESLLETNISFAEPDAVGDRGINALLVGIYLTPLFSHFVFDAFLWKRNHRESPLIYTHL